MPYFCPFAADFGGFEGVFSFINNKSATPCQVDAIVVDSYRSSSGIVHKINLQKILFYVKKSDIIMSNHKVNSGIIR